MFWFPFHCAIYELAKTNCDGIIAEYAETEESPVIKPERYILGDKEFFQSLKHTCTYEH